MPYNYLIIQLRTQKAACVCVYIVIYVLHTHTLSHSVYTTVAPTYLPNFIICTSPIT